MSVPEAHLELKRPSQKSAHPWQRYAISRGSSDSGNGSSPRNRPEKKVHFSTVETSGISAEEEPRRSSDLETEGSPRNRPKPEKSNQVKHKAKHKTEPKNEPTKPDKEFSEELLKIRNIYEQMLVGNLVNNKNNDYRRLQKRISDVLRVDPDFPLMKIVDEQLMKFI